MPTFDRVAIRARVSCDVLCRLVALFLGETTVLSWVELGGGSSKLAYRVETPTRTAVLYVLPPTIIGQFERAARDAAYELAFAGALAGGGVPVPRRYPALDGQGFATAEIGGIPCFLSLHAFVTGQIVLVLDRVRLQAAAATVARAHVVGRGLRLAPARMGGFHLAARIASEAWRPRRPPAETALTKDARDLLGTFAETATAARARILGAHGETERFPIHGDLGPRNLLWDGLRLAGVLDLDECHTDGAWVDLALALEDLCRHDADGAAATAASFLGDYAQVVELPPLDLELTLQFWLFRQAAGGYDRLAGLVEPSVRMPDRLEAAERRLSVVHQIRAFLAERHHLGRG